VLSASLYIIACSTRNRARQRLRRLREPRYLAGAVVGAAYLYFSFVARLRSTRSNPGRAARARRTRGGTPFDVPGLAATAPAFAGIALMGAAALSWLAPFESGLLEFSEAETQFLFPAPLTRRQLLVHRLLRSQLGLLFGAVVFGITVPSSSGYRRLWVGLAMWVLLVTGKIYFTAVSLTRARIRAASGAARVRAWLPAAIVTAAIAIVATALMRAFYAAPPSGIADIVALVGGVSQQPVPRVVLWPFVALVRPVFAASTAAYLPALASALAVLAAATLWMFRSDEVFHVAADEAARRRSRRSQGRPQVTYKARAEEWKLAPTGRPEAAFAWKALMQTLRVFNRREVVRTVAILTALTAVAAATNREGPAALLGGFAIAAAAFAILMAPQIVRIDMRQDLQHLELLKTWPVRGPSIVRGQLVWPAVMITAIAWTMLAVALTLSGIVLPRVGLVWRLASTGAVAILAPALVLAQLTVHNAVALMFPAWVPLGFQRARGLDAIGQRIIMLGGTWLLLIVMTVPGALAAGIFWLIVGRFFGPLMLIPAATAAAGVIAVEVLLATEALGPVYERLDVLAVERVE
jgi:ABC-2 type transport system permease protein